MKYHFKKFLNILNGIILKLSSSTNLQIIERKITEELFFNNNTAVGMY